MAERYDFYVHDNRKITFNLTEPIMREDSGVTDFIFHIPKILNELEVSDWQWWLVFVNAKKEKYSIALTLSDDPESPLEKNVATYTVDYAMSIKAGSVQFALEAINTGTGGAIDNEWHTLTYETKVKETLQGNQAEYAETESDIISELLQNVRTKVNQLVGGATPEPKSLIADMTDTKKVYLYVGSEPGESTNYWYYYNGSAWVPGGLYSAGIVDAVPTQGSTNAVSSGGVYDVASGKASAIVGTLVDPAFSNAVGTENQIIVYGNSFESETIKIANKAQYAFPSDSYVDKTSNGVTFTEENGFLVVDGTCTATATYVWIMNNDSSDDVPERFLGKTVNFRMVSDKPCTLAADGAKTPRIQFFIDGNNKGEIKPSASANTIVDASGSVNVPADAEKWRLIWVYNTVGSVFDNVKFKIYAYEPTATVFDTEETVENGESVILSIPEGYEVVDTGCHRNAIYGKWDTKEYVDNHIPTDMVTSSEMESYVEGYVAEYEPTVNNIKYVTPEMFGAKGDGSTDDSTALQDCIDYATANGIPVRGFGRYNITTGITITPSSSYSYTDVYLFFLSYSGNGSDDAVTISGQANKFVCTVLTSYYATNSNSALKLKGITGASKYNEIHIIRCYGYNNVFDIDSGDGGVLYNKIYVNRIISRYGNCFYIHGNSNTEENDYYCKSVSCQNGYVVYSSKSGVNRFYDLGIENECANGVYGVVKLINARTTECMDQKQSDITKGNIYVIPSGNMGHSAEAEGTLIDLEAFDVSNADSYDDRIDLLVEKYESGTSKFLSLDTALGGVGVDFNVSKCKRVICDNVPGYTSGVYKKPVYGTLISYYNHKGFVPDVPVTANVSESDFYTAQRAFPTKMVMEANSTIHLDDSYCCVGIREFYIEQTNTHKAVVYDKNNTLLFDGTNKDAGLYKFMCEFVALETLEVELTGGTILTYDAMAIQWLYTGDNEKWTIEKLNIVG